MMPSQARIWIGEHLHQSVAAFGIDLLAFAILSNHFHRILRSRPDVVATWDDREAARRWLIRCPHGNLLIPRLYNRQNLRSTQSLIAPLSEMRFASDCPTSISECDCSVSAWPSKLVTRNKRRAGSLKIDTVRLV